MKTFLKSPAKRLLSTRSVRRSSNVPKGRIELDGDGHDGELKGNGKWKERRGKEKDRREEWLEVAAKGARPDLILGNEGKPLAGFRLAAMRHAESMPRIGGGLPPTPAQPGLNNWLALGPQGIPNGQTYSAARVLVSGRVTAIATHPTDPDTIYLAGARGGVWKTVDGGATWNSLADDALSLAMGALAISPSDPQVLYAGTGEGNLQNYVTNYALNSAPDNYFGNGILRSVDGGASWTAQGVAEFTGAAFFRIVVHPADPQTAFAATSGGLFRTNNGGANWTQMTSGLPAISATIIAATDIVINPTNPDVAYAAFWGDGVYQTANATAATPTWTKQSDGLPSTSLGRLCLAIAPSSPESVYVLLGDVSTETFAGLYVSSIVGGAIVWNVISLSLSGVTGSSSYTCDLQVDPNTPDILYISGTSLFKATRDSATDTWSKQDIGAVIHPDAHCLAFHPTDHLTIFAGNDGGIYKSTNGGATWSDTINRELCLLQYESMDQHPTSDAVLIGGTQDNGTEMFRNSEVFYHSDEGDGGCVAIDQTTPQNILHGFYGRSLVRSTKGGQFEGFSGWAQNVTGGLQGSGIFYPPFVLNASNQNEIAYGTNEINLSTDQGVSGWPTQIALPGITAAERVSALAYPNASLIYAATTAGKIYRLTRTGGTWTATAIQTAALPARWVWDIETLPGDPNTIIVGFAGFGVAHVWRAVIDAGGTATWTSISGSGASALPDIPVFALAIDPTNVTTIFAGTDIGVFRTTDGGTSWTPFSQGLPNVAIYDLRLHQPSRLLRAATHGRGMWELPVDANSAPARDIYVRDHIMHTGRTTPNTVAAAFADPTRQINLGDILYWYECADIKVDALNGSPPAYQMNVSDVNYVAFESTLQHRDPRRGNVNRVYVQVHNRGVVPAQNVTVKIMFANASAGLPDLPSDFWAVFPADPAPGSPWTPVGNAQTIPSLEPGRPVVLEWDWTPPTTAADHSCMLVVMDSASDPIPTANKVRDIATLVTSEKRVGLKNLHLIDAAPGTIVWHPFGFAGRKLKYRIRFIPSSLKGWKIGMMLPKKLPTIAGVDGFKIQKPSAAMLAALQKKLGRKIADYDTNRIYLADVARPATIDGVKIPKGSMEVMLALVPPLIAGKAGKLTILQEDGNRIIGGSTFVLTATKRTSRNKIRNN